MLEIFSTFGFNLKIIIMKKILLLLCVTIGTAFSSMAQVPGCATMTTPANLATNVTLGGTSADPSVALAWTAPTTGGAVTGYKIRWGASAATMTVLGTTSATALGVNITGITANTTYFWQALPTNATGDAVCTTIFSFTTGALPAAATTTCLIGDLYPAATYTPVTCNGTTANIIAADTWAGEYSNVNVTAGQTYKFQSSVATDYIKISTTAAPTVIAAQGTGSVTWTATATEVIRFYIHIDNLCNSEDLDRTRTVYCGASLSVITFDASQFSIYPNPTSDLLNVKVAGSGSTITAVQITDLNGRQIMTKAFDNVSDAQINVNNLSAGMYLINITSGDTSVTKKFLKK